MHYIYDVLINLNNPPYNSFEWNKSDDINHLRKIPIIRVSTQTLYDLINKKVKLDSKFLDLIKNKTEQYNNKSIEVIEYMAIFTDTNINVCIKFMDSINILKSYLQFEENEEIDDLSPRLNTINIEYTIIQNEDKINFKTRKELKDEEYILKNLKNLKANNDLDKLKYIYYDCFNKLEDDINIITNKLSKELDNNIIKYKIYNFFKLILTKNN